MEILTKEEEAGEIAAKYIFHFMEELGSSSNGCIKAAKDIYEHFTSKTLNTEKVLGINEENFINEEYEEFESLIDIDIF